MNSQLAHWAPLEIWCVDVAGAASAEQRLSSTLDDEERGRASRFARPADAARYRIAHGALRTILSRRIGIAPHRIRFARGEHGKPCLRDGGPRFSLSHSGTLALVAVSEDREVGVDVEVVRPIPDAAALARRFFSPEEAQTIASQPRRRRDLQFMRSWTALEAIVKAQGTGLAAAFDEHIAGDPARLCIGEDRAWSVRRLALAQTHVGAVAARGGHFSLRMRWFQ